MLAKDPVKRGLNAYPYCKSNPVNYVDPTGELANILGAGIIGGLVGGGFGFAGSAVSQISHGEQFDVRKALGSAANGAVVGAVRGALVGSGVGLAAGLAYNFTAGAAGSAMEQKIGMGSVNVGQSVVGGLTNAVSGAIYGNKALKSAQDALLRGARAGAATAAINNLSNAWNNRNSGLSGNTGKSNRTTGGLSTSPYAVNRDPRAVCGASSPFESNIGYRTGYGYQSRDSESKQTKQGGFSLVDFGKDVLIGAVMGGLSSLTFYGAGKAVEAVKGSIRSSRVSKGGVEEAVTKAKPYSNSRPSYGKGQVEEVWNNARDPVTGKVYDPTNVEHKWNPTKPRNGQWDMGHIPGEKYSDIHKLYMDGTLSKQEFLNWYRNPNNYRPELPSTNRGHKFE